MVVEIVEVSLPVGPSKARFLASSLLFLLQLPQEIVIICFIGLLEVVKALCGGNFNALRFLYGLKSL